MHRKLDRQAFFIAMQNRCAGRSITPVGLCRPAASPWCTPEPESAELFILRQDLRRCDKTSRKLYHGACAVKTVVLLYIGSKFFIFHARRAFRPNWAARQRSLI
jgi:hypothetical protein